MRMQWKKVGDIKTRTEVSSHKNNLAVFLSC